jgi:hypothetical protein
MNLIEDFFLSIKKDIRRSTAVTTAGMFKLIENGCRATVEAGYSWIIRKFCREIKAKVRTYEYLAASDWEADELKRITDLEPKNNEPNKKNERFVRKVPKKNKREVTPLKVHSSKRR